MDKPSNFGLCAKALQLGFPQKRKFQSMYYVQPDVLVCIDDLSALKQDAKTDFEDIFSKLVFKPKLEDLVEETPFLREFIRMSDGTWFAYSDVEEDPEYIKETGRTDTAIRARGANMWEALLNLYIAVKGKDKKPTFTEIDAETSENKQEGIEPEM